jgi:DNA repair exonuclease SbcCD ATPase subunit
MQDERQKLLNEYAATSRAFSDAVERLRCLNTDIEALIRALDETGTAHRACEQSRIRLDKHLSQRWRVTLPETSR